MIDRSIPECFSWGPPDIPQAKLERMFINQFLAAIGYCSQDLSTLPETTKRNIMIEASKYASCKLAEIETRSILINELLGVHHAKPPDSFDTPVRKSLIKPPKRER